MEEQVIAGAGASVDRQQQALDSFQEGASESKPCVEMGDGNGASVPRAMLKCRGGNQVPDLNLSLLPSRETLETFGAPQQTNETPFAGFPSLNWGGVPPFTNVNDFRSPSEESKTQHEHEHEHAQLTIFYGGTVHVYNVSTDMAKAIMMVANSNNSPTSWLAQSQLWPTLSEAAFMPKPAVKLPICRRNSLKRFLEKRKYRGIVKLPHFASHHN